MVSFNADEKVIKTKMSVDNPITWNGKINPHLYTLEAILTTINGQDKIEQTFGIRSFSIDPNKGFVLNGQPYKIFGVSRHQEWQQYGPALTNEHHKEDIQLIKEIGASAIRLAHYQQSDIMYEEADKNGLLIWAEIPFVHDYGGREGNNAKEQLKELILQNYNHPSIFTWGIWNEVRAYDNPKEYCVPLTKELVEIAHQLDTTRPTTSASDREFTSNMGNIIDLQAWNKYFGWYYGKTEDMGSWIDKGKKLFPNRPIGISEYGVGGNVQHQDICLLEKPSGIFFS